MKGKVGDLERQDSDRAEAQNPQHFHFQNKYYLLTALLLYTKFEKTFKTAAYSPNSFTSRTFWLQALIYNIYIAKHVPRLLEKGLDSRSERQECAGKDKKITYLRDSHTQLT